MLLNIVLSIVLMGTLIYAFKNCMYIISMFMNVHQKDWITTCEDLLKL